MKCEKCHREAKVYTKPNGNSHSEQFYTNKEGKTVCISCLGVNPKTLQQLNEDRNPKRRK